MILVCLLCTHSWHTFIRSPFACNAASCSVEVLLVSLRFSARLASMFRLDCSEWFELRCSELLTDSLIALYNSFT